MNIFEQVKSSTDIVRVAQFYGIKIKKNKAHCPFHSDQKPSMSFKNNRCRCFTCNETLSCIDLVQKVLSCTVLDAAKSINDSFNLNIDFGKKITPQEINDLQNILKEKEAQQKEIKEKNKQKDLYFREILHKHYELRKQKLSDEFFTNLKELRRLEDDYFGD